jgi:hypothetical protein
MAASYDGPVLVPRATSYGGPVAVSISGDELAARVALDDEALARSDPPLVLVELGSGDAPPVDLAALPCVFVGLGDCRGPLADAVDVVTDDERVVAAIERSVASTPLAAVALALLLRGRDGRSIDQALVAESTTYSLLQAGPEFARWRRTHPIVEAPPDPGPPVLVEDDAGRLRITLHRPHRHNAYSSTMRDHLVDALRLAIADPDRRVLLDGSGPTFSSGGDLAEFGRFGDAPTSHVVRLTRSAARLLARLSDRVEAHVHGPCFGAGVELPAFAGRVIADVATTFTLPELALGLIPGAGGTASLPPRIGRQRTARMALTGEAVDAPTALQWGLVDELSG